MILVNMVVYAVFKLIISSKETAQVDNFDVRQTRQGVNTEEHRQTVKKFKSWSSIEEGQTEAELNAMSYNRMYLIITQALNFLSCYALARIIAAKRFYHDEEVRSEQWMIITYVLVYVVNSLVLMPYSLPNAAIQLVVPPYMDAKDHARLEKLIPPDGSGVKGIDWRQAARMLARRGATWLKMTNNFEFVDAVHKWHQQHEKH